MLKKHPPVAGLGPIKGFIYTITENYKRCSPSTKGHVYLYYSLIYRTYKYEELTCIINNWTKLSFIQTLVGIRGMDDTENPIIYEERQADRQ